MSLPDIIAAASTACVRHWSLLVRIALLGALVTVAVDVTLLKIAPDIPEGAQPNSAEVSRWLRNVSPLLGVAVLASLFTHLALVRAALTILRGESAALGTSLATAARALPAAMIAAVVAVMAGAILTATLLLAPLALFLLVNWLLTAQTLVDDGGGGFAALRRSRQIVRGQWWRTCMIGLSVLVLYLFPSILLGRVAGALDSEWAAGLMAGLSFLVSAPFLAFGHTQLYLDIRARKGEPVRRPAPPEDRTI